ncbi:Msb1p Ecym_3091 [Eremothecium cymbalariae DBVPG|uniref:Meiotically up-regulated protein Msb1/Mug8 domain-containing protein n=1 Tax=Eremothecium cymbalariae (strain CBS 270.75 / DBVPG 7215 / KCTC 17166 / NRRL Y-17582) TaxID=931890 RepID=G8JR31_ERECY|nr:Hypothetical protein Ecym_3091 [Eremothecium cymbalariae DBVPG\
MIKSSKPLPELPELPGDFNGQVSMLDEARRSLLGGSKLPGTEEEEEGKRGHDDGVVCAGSKEVEGHFEFCEQFKWVDCKVVVRSITQRLKTGGMQEEYVLLPFRSGQVNQKLLRFLSAIFPDGGDGGPVNEAKLARIVNGTGSWTLVQALKYIWCRVPGREVIGWKAYREFEREERVKGYPAGAFLEILPQFLASPEQASVVYDFFDLLVSVAANSKSNKMSARKVSRMCAIWAFGKEEEREATGSQVCQNNSFREGLDMWIPGSDAMFHLFLSFMRSFVHGDLGSADIPKSLKSVLFTNEYPPAKYYASVHDSVLTVPVVTLKTDRFSNKPWELLQRCSDLFVNSNPGDFAAREDYVMMKSLFKNRDSIHAFSKMMSGESRRLMREWTTKHSTFQAGWPKNKCVANEQCLAEHLVWGRAEIDDYFIWTWMSTLSHEQSTEKRKIFGRSLIVEFEFDGIKKWVIVEESDIVIDSIKMAADEAKAVVEAAANEESEYSSELPPALPVLYNRQVHVGANDAGQAPAKSKNVYRTVVDLSKRHLSRSSQEYKKSKWNPINQFRKKSIDSTVGGGNSVRQTSSRYDDQSVNSVPEYQLNFRASAYFNDAPRNIWSPPTDEKEQSLENPMDIDRMADETALQYTESNALQGSGGSPERVHDPVEYIGANSGAENAGTVGSTSVSESSSLVGSTTSTNSAVLPLHLKDSADSFRNPTPREFYSIPALEAQPSTDSSNSPEHSDPPVYPQMPVWSPERSDQRVSPIRSTKDDQRMSPTRSLPLAYNLHPPPQTYDAPQPMQAPHPKYDQAPQHKYQPQPPAPHPMHAQQYDPAPQTHELQSPHPQLPLPFDMQARPQLPHHQRLMQNRMSHHLPSDFDLQHPPYNPDPPYRQHHHQSPPVRPYSQIIPTHYSPRPPSPAYPINPHRQQPHLARAARYRSPNPHPAPDYTYAPQPLPLNKLHGGAAAKKQGRKNLYNHIRTGNFGI